MSVLHLKTRVLISVLQVKINKALFNCEKMSLIDKFTSYLKARGAKEHTVKTYLRYVNKLLEFCSELTLECVLKFMAQYSGKAPLTQSTIAYALRAFFESNPQLNIDYNLIPIPSRIDVTRKIITIPEQDIRKMAGGEDIRVGAILALMYEVGLRVSEVGKIQCSDLNVNDWTIYVRRSKGSISSTLPIVSDWVKDVVKSYLLIHKCEKPDIPLFPGYGGKGISYTRVSAIIKNVLRKYGYVDAHPHDIRHSRATNLLKAGVDVVTVSHILGHKTLTSTSKYLHLVVEDIRRKLEEAIKTKS